MFSLVPSLSAATVSANDVPILHLLVADAAVLHTPRSDRLRSSDAQLRASVPVASRRQPAAPDATTIERQHAVIATAAAQRPAADHQRAAVTGGFR